MGSGTPALERCVGDVEDFFAKHWGRAPLLRPGADKSGAFGDLASLGDLDHMIASMGLDAARLRMVRDGKTLPVSTYTTGSSRSVGRAGPVSAAQVYRHFSEGATIVVESLQRYWRPLTHFCRELELALGHRSQVNAYITPPGSQGFAVHRDDHDVFVLQVSGSKHWIVYDRADEDHVLIDKDIERGSALYIPEGFPHAATAGASASAHLTVGILTHDSGDILSEVVKLAQDEPAFQERLPTSAARDPVALRETVAAHLDELRAWLDKADPDEVTRRVARRIMTSAQPILRGQLHQLELLESVDSDTQLGRRPGASCFLFRDDAALRVLLTDRELWMPLEVEPAMSEVARRERLSARDLHPWLTPDSALVLVKRLVREGLLEVVVDH